MAATYYVTQSGAGSGNGSSLSNAWSVSQFNSTTSTADGDTVIFDGTFTSTVIPADSASSASNPIKLDFSRATLNTANPRVRIQGRSNLTLSGAKLGASSSGTLISFNNGYSNNITIDGFSYTGNSNGTALFTHLNYCTNFVVQNCTVDNVSGFVFGDSKSNGDITIRNNYVRTSTNTSVQTDIVKIGDASNVMIEGNKLIERAPGATSERHNDIIQCYMKGGSNAGNPSNWTIRYNWLELDIVGSSSGDTSWLQLEHMAGSPTCKIYSNVFLGNEANGWSGNNGFGSSNQSRTSTFYVYNNTVIRKKGPDRTIGFITGGTLYSRNNVGMSDADESGTFIDWAAMTEGGGSNGWDYNYWYQFDGANSNHAGPNGSTSANPLFTNYAGNNFSLQASSPLVGKGDKSIGAEYSKGIASNATWPNPTLVNRTSWDIGAYVYGGGGGTTPPPVDTTAPVVSGVKATPTTTGATISWTTNEAATGRVEYGPTSSYGSTATSATATSHSVALSGLTAGTTYSYRVRSTDAAGNVSTAVTGTFTTVASAGQIAAQPTSLSFGQVTVGTSANLSLTVKNNGGSSVTGRASVSAPFSIVSGGSYTIAAGASHVVAVRYSPTAATASNGSVALTGGGGGSVPVSGTGVAVTNPGTPGGSTGTPVEAESGTLSGPFTSSNGTISQDVETTDVASSGRAAYKINVAEAGEYSVVLSVAAPNEASNSLFLNIDAEPQDPTMIWDIPVTTTTPQSRTGAWRGTGTPEKNEYAPKYFTLTAGTHEVIIRGREAGVRIDKVSLVKRPTAPQQLQVEAESGTLTAPFTSSNGAISQDVQTTDVASSGRASYKLNVTEAGQYAVVLAVSAPNEASNSLFLNINAEPQDPTMVWDIPVTTTTPQSRTGAWRGTGTPEKNEHSPKYFELAAGTHEIIIRGREAGVRIDKVSLVKRPSSPTLNT
ncbi:MAG: hypothetical protein EOP84_04085, partial [Verrucomicrobiaceae bacterium]